MGNDIEWTCGMEVSTEWPLLIYASRVCSAIMTYLIITLPCFGSLMIPLRDDWMSWGIFTRDDGKQYEWLT